MSKSGKTITVTTKVKDGDQVVFNRNVTWQMLRPGINLVGSNLGLDADTLVVIPKGETASVWRATVWNPAMLDCMVLTTNPHTEHQDWQGCVWWWVSSEWLEVTWTPQ